MACTKPNLEQWRRDDGFRLRLECLFAKELWFKSAKQTTDNSPALQAGIPVEKDTQDYIRDSLCYPHTRLIPVFPTILAIVLNLAGSAVITGPRS